MKKSNIVLLSFLIIAGLIIIISSFNYDEGMRKSSPNIENGVLDLYEWNFEEKGIVPIKGNWEFYPNEFINTLGHFGRVNSRKIHAPGLWNDFEIDNEKFGSYGFGTYRTIVKIRDTREIYGLKMPTFATSYKLFINGKYICKNGEVGRPIYEKGKNNIPIETTKPQWLPQIVGFKTQTQNIEIVVQVSNFHHIKGGMWGPIIFGKYDQILHEKYKSISVDAFVIGSLLIIGGCYLGLYFIRKKNIAILYFGLFCIVSVLRILVIDEILLTTFFKNISFQHQAKLEYVTLALGLLFFTLYIHYLYHKKISKLMLRVVNTICILYSVVILIFPLNFFAKFLTLFQTFIGIVIFYILSIVFRAIKNGKIESKIMLVGTLVLFTTIINDIIYSNGLRFILNTNNSVLLGLRIFTLCQVFILVLRFSSALRKSELLTEKLENKVRERTEELEKANRKLYQISTKDRLTSLYNRQKFEEVIKSENKKYSKDHNRMINYSVLYIDIDDFKYFNDKYGHGVGDSILIKFGKIIKKIIRPEDYVFRVGGDEFVIFLPGMDNNQAFITADKIRTQLSKKELFVNELKEVWDKIVLSHNNKITCSIGISHYIIGNDFDLTRLIDIADNNLLRSKRRGKNKISV